MVEVEGVEFALGRVTPPNDPRDKAYPMSLALAALPGAIPPSRYWTPGVSKLNQGSLGACVAFAGTNWLQSSPVRTKPVSNEMAKTIYYDCKAIDGIPNQEGTYDRALMKVLSARGHVKRYLWATTPDEIKTWVLTTGPVLIATPWYNGMFYPDAKTGLVTPSNGIAGYHETCVDGYSKTRDWYRVQNSWGAGWGQNGSFWLKASDLYEFVFKQGGDACAAEQKLPSK